MSDWTKRNAQALLREFRAHGLGTGARLLNYRGEDLRGQAFPSDESLAGADFQGADLSDAQFGGVDLSGADLSGCRLAGARLDRTNLAGARLTEANLDGASLIGADLRGAALDGTTWRRARLTGALLPDGIPPNAWGAALPAEFLRLEMSSSGGVGAVLAPRCRPARGGTGITYRDLGSGGGRGGGRVGGPRGLGAGGGVVAGWVSGG